MALENFGINETKPEGLASFNHHLYMVAQGDTTMSGSSRSRTAALYEVEAATGVASRISDSNDADDFGVGEELPTGLEEHNGKLYMVGTTKKHLYEVNTTTGLATPVRAEIPTQFGISEDNPRTLAAHNGVMYFVGHDTDYLCTLDLATGVATRIGTETNFGISGLTITDLTSDGNNLYAVGSGTGGINGLYTLNIVTGLATKIEEDSFGIPETDPESLATDGTRAWLVGNDTDYLTELNLVSGIAKRVGHAQSTNFGLGSDWVSGAVGTDGTTVWFYPKNNDGTTASRLRTLNLDTSEAGSIIGTTSNVGNEIYALAYGGPSGSIGLYGINNLHPRLRKVNTSDGTFEATLGAINFNVNEQNPRGLAFVGNTLYMVGESEQKLYTVNVTSGNFGNASLVQVTSFHISETSPQSFANHGGTTYFVGVDTNQLCSLDLTTGIATTIGPAGFGVSETSPRGLASDGTNLYMVGSTNTELYTVDTTTGIATGVISGTTSFGITETRPESLATDGTTTWLIGDDTNALYELNTSTLQATRVGSSSNWDVSETDAKGLAYANSKLYMVGSATKKLYEVDTSDGTASVIPTPLPANYGLTSEISVETLLFASGGTTYLVGTRGFYTIDLTTGQATQVGTNYFTDSNHFIDAAVIGKAPQAGVILAASNTSHTLFTIDPSTGAETNRQNPFVVHNSSGNTSPLGGPNQPGVRDWAYVGNTLYVIGTQWLYQVTTLPGTFGASHDVIFQEVGRMRTSGSFAGIASNGTTTWVVGNSTNERKLYTVNISNGTLTQVGNLNDGFGVNETYPQSLVYNGSTLYMLGNNTDRIYTLDTSTGAATELGAGVDHFGISEQHPESLATDGTTTWFIGSDTNALYTLNTSTLKVTRVDDNTIDWGIGEKQARGLTHVGSALYMVGATNKTLYQVDKTTGVASLPFSWPANFGITPRPSRIINLVIDGSNAYISAFHNSNRKLYSLNLSTGKTTPKTGIYNLQISNISLIDGTIYGISPTTGVWTINTSDGTSTHQGNFASPAPSLSTVAGLAKVTSPSPSKVYAVFDNKLYTCVLSTETFTLGTFGTTPDVGVLTLNGSNADNLTGLASDGTTLWAVGDTSGYRKLFSINTTTGVLTQVGSIDDGFGVGANDPVGLSYSNSTLYMLGNGTRRLYTLNTDTTTATAGAATVVEASAPANFNVGETDPQDLATTGSAIYMLGGHNNRIYQLSPSTGAGVALGGASFGTVENDPKGLAHDGSKFFMTGSQHDALYTLSPTGYTATRVDATTTDFGASISDPKGLLISGSTLYMLADDNNGSLWTLDTSDGTATRVVASGTNFGVSDPRDLASHGTTVHILDGATNQAYELNTTTGNTLPVAPASFASVGTITENDPQGIANDGTNLYIVGNQNDQLSTLNIVSGALSRIGTATEFGESIDSPKGLLATGTGATAVLYMLADDDSGTLWTLSKTAGTATSLPTPIVEFGVSETAPRDLASNGTTIYLLGGTTDSLYTLDTSSGFGTIVGSTFTADENDPQGIAHDGTNLYMVGGEHNALYTIDTGTGAITRVPSSSPPTQFGVLITSPRGLMVDSSSNLYMLADEASGTLWSLNKATGFASRIGVPPSGFGVSETAPQALASDGTTLWMTGSATHILYTLDLVTGQATAVGATYSSIENHPTDMVYSNNYLYMIGEQYSRLYLVDTLDGQPETLGEAPAGFGINELAPRGLTYIGNTLYMVGNTQKYLSRINLITGKAKRIGNSSAFGLSLTNIGDLTSDSTRIWMTTNGTEIYTISLTDGSATPVVNTSHGVTNITGIAYGGSNHVNTNILYAIGSTSIDSATLYEIDVNNASTSNTVRGSTGVVGITNTKGLLNSNKNPTTGVISDMTSSNPLYTVSSNNNGSLYKLNAATYVASHVVVAGFGLTVPETDPRGLVWGGAAGSESLYLIGGTTNKLYTIETRFGTATEVASLSPSTHNLYGLDYIGTTFYSVGTTPAALYTVSDSGAVARVAGSVTNFGTHSGETQPRAIAHIIDNSITTTYMLGQTQDGIYQLDLSAGTALPLGIGPGFGQTSPVSPLALVSNGTNLYLFGESRVWTLNLDTSNLNPTNGLGTVTNGVAYSPTTLVPGGVAYRGGVYYITADDTDTLRTFDITAGTSTVVGTANRFGPSAIEDTPRGLAFLDSRLYMVGQSNAALYSVNPSTGIATRIGVILDIRILGTELILRSMFCKPASGEVGPGNFQFNEANVNKHFPVTLAGVPDSDTGLPVVKVTKGQVSNEVIFGKFIDISGKGDDTIVTIAVEGEDIRFNRGPVTPAITLSHIGQGIQGSGTVGMDGIVEAAPITFDTRGIIIGGNVTRATIPNDGFFRVNFKSS